MDLKRAWRNGFLVSLIFAIPLSDFYYNQFSNLIVNNSARKTRGQYISSCGTDASCSGFSDSDIGDIAERTTSWDNNGDENGLTIPESTLTDLLLDSGDADFNDIRRTAIQFDPQEIFQSERIGEVDLDADIGSMASLSYGFRESAYAPGFSGPFMPAMFGPGGKTVSAGIRIASGGDSETPFVDPLTESSTQTDTASSGLDNESLHNVPEPSSLVMITIGTISVASLLNRKSKSPARRMF